MGEKKEAGGGLEKKETKKRSRRKRWRRKGKKRREKRVGRESGAGANRSLVAGEITFCNSTVRRRILIPSINLAGSSRTNLFDPVWSILFSAVERLSEHP